MTTVSIMGRAAQIANWASRLGALDAPRVSGAIDFHATDRDGPWWHRCVLVDGVIIDWRPVRPTPLAISHGADDLIDLYEQRSAFDRRWRALYRGASLRPLPPWDCAGRFGSRALIVPGIDTSIEWRSVCEAPGGCTVSWITAFGRESIDNEMEPGPDGFTGPSFRFPIQTYLGLRAGDDPLTLFDEGGSIDGDLEELLFIAGIVSDPMWAAQWALRPSDAEVLAAFLLSYPGRQQSG